MSGGGVNPQPQIGLRLAAIADRVLPGEPMADVGTDHALLVIALVGEGRVPRAVATDRSVSTLARARRQVAAHGLSDRIDIRLGEGLAPLRRHEVTTVVIAGVGNHNIAEIVQEGREVALALGRLVVQPTQGAPETRQSLADLGFSVVDEDLVYERGRYHTVIACEPVEGPIHLTDAERALGPVLRDRRGIVFERWLEAEAHATEGRLTILEGQNAPAAVRTRLATYLDLLREERRR